ncbi:MAG TPA: hypothetical protein VMH05_24550 [Bryobacteraceae bacterium]|nr:hypothetical protein [Bryobacteraceae bacterium]
MIQHLALSEAQLNLILELLEGEQKELLLEIRHTDTANFRVSLKERLATLEAVLLKVKSLEAAERV